MPVGPEEVEEEGEEGAPEGEEKKEQEEEDGTDQEVLTRGHLKKQAQMVLEAKNRRRLQRIQQTKKPAPSSAYFVP